MRRRSIRAGILGWLVVVAGPGLVLAQPPGRTPADAHALLDSPASPQGYDRLLHEYVVRLPSADGVLTTGFDYDRLAAFPEQERLREDLRRRFLDAHPDGMDASTRTAWALNTYNFLVIDLVMDHYRNAEGERLRSIADIGKGNFAVFDEPWFELRRTAYSLNAFERHFLFHDVDRDAKEIPDDLDPRLHFALVCAAKGCPPLWPRPFQPETLDEDLNAVSRNALRSPRHLRDDGRLLHLSKIFEWYAPDFERYGGVAGFLQRFGPPEVQEVLAAKGSRVKLATDIEWDWTLNAP